MSRLEKIEVKCAIVPDDTEAALRQATLGKAKELRRVDFYDTPTLTLFKSGIIVRTREGQGKGDTADLTLKVRGEGEGDDLAQRASDHWRAMSASVAVEAELEGDKSVGRVMSPAFSICFALARSVAEEMRSGRVPLEQQLGPNVMAMLVEVGADVSLLREAAVFGPIESQRWKTEIDGVDGKVSVELWTTPNGARLLELSDKTDVDRPERVADLERGFIELTDRWRVRRLTTSKTRFALERGFSR